MRMILGLVILGGLVCAYWFGAAYLLRKAPARLAERGVQVDAITVSGFPAQFNLALTKPALRARGWSADWARLSLRAYWPFTATGHLSGQQNITWRGANVQLDGADMPATLALSPGLALETARISGRDMVLGGAISGRLHTAALELSRGTTAAEYALALDLDGLQLASFRQVVPTAMLRATLRFAKPLRPTIRQVPQDIELVEASIDLGMTRMQATGTLTRRADARWDGAIALTLSDWPVLMTTLEDMGIMRPDQAPMVRMMAQSMAKGETLSLPLTVAGSVVSLGPLALWDFGRF